MPRDLHRGAYALPSTDGGPRSALAFLGDRDQLVRRFLLAEVLAPPLALRGHSPSSPLHIRRPR